jgi:CRISPR-associated protein Cas1
MEEEILWPARHVAEYVYCPRLFYFMQVEGVFVPSADTEKGASVHQRVNRPSQPPSDATSSGQDDPESPQIVRSLALTSESLGLTGTLDLAEISGRTAVPVEYRKGRPRRSPTASPPQAAGSEESGRANVEPWPADRVQVGLQALLLEEAGYCVTEAVIYYAEEKLRLRLAIDDDVRRESLEALENARRCAQGPRPLPLVNDPRCPRCSLQPVCLPDEINHQRAAPAGEQPSPRRIWPPREEGIHIVAQQEGIRIGVQGTQLRVTDKTGGVVRTLPLATIESLSLLGSVQLTTQAVHALAAINVPVAFLSTAGRLIAMIDPMDSVSAEVRRCQVRRLDCPEMCLELARALVAAKITNQRTLLMRNHPSLPAGVAAQLAGQARLATTAQSMDAVRGHEGQAAAVYFAHFGGMFKGPLGGEFDANGRKRQPPPDPINACLSMGYAMLSHECVSALRLARLEPSIGALHVSRPGRPALALDLMEPFRPLIADSLAVTCFNRGELAEGHFLRTAAGCALTDAGRRAFFNALGRRMDTEVTHPVFEYRLSYRRMIVLHARMIAAWLTGDIPTLAFLTTR